MVSDLILDVHGVRRATYREHRGGGTFAGGVRHELESTELLLTAVAC